MISSNILIKILVFAVPVVFSIVVHEVSHGWMAYKLGDDTAKKMGRLTLNPIPHIDPLGTIILPLLMIIAGGPIFGWAKPVPFNPNNFNRTVDFRNGVMWVALAGPGSNLILAFISSFIYVFMHKFIAIASVTYTLIFLLLDVLIYINILLACFNLIPIPPLDGSKVLIRFLPENYTHYFLKLERYGMMILIILLATGVISDIIIRPIDYLYNLFLLIPQSLLG
ncbi:MAG: site-2 protease family protein [Deltaproteobacteria bacterium]|nr:site-2 protease family protein [Deltaproteobacteria bacterium]